MAKVEVKSVVFKNFDYEKFVCSWDSVPYTFPAGKEMYVEDWKAAHFAKHLVNKVMTRQGLIITNMMEREPLLRKALPDGIELTVDEALDVNAREEVAEKVAEVKETAKAKKASKVVVEEEFADLKTAKAKK